jgi:hypothetical protein
LLIVRIPSLCVRPPDRISNRHAWNVPAATVTSSVSFTLSTTGSKSGFAKDNRGHRRTLAWPSKKSRCAREEVRPAIVVLPGTRSLSVRSSSRSSALLSHRGPHILLRIRVFPRDRQSLSTLSVSTSQVHLSQYAVCHISSGMSKYCFNASESPSSSI